MYHGNQSWSEIATWGLRELRQHYLALMAVHRDQAQLLVGRAFG